MRYVNQQHKAQSVQFASLLKEIKKQPDHLERPKLFSPFSPDHSLKPALFYFTGLSAYAHVALISHVDDGDFTLIEDIGCRDGWISDLEDSRENGDKAIVIGHRMRLPVGFEADAWHSLVERANAYYHTIAPKVWTRGVYFYADVEKSFFSLYTIIPPTWTIGGIATISVFIRDMLFSYATEAHVKTHPEHATLRRMTYIRPIRAVRSDCLLLADIAPTLKEQLIKEEFLLWPVLFNYHHPEESGRVGAITTSHITGPFTRNVPIKDIKRHSVPMAPLSYGSHVYHFTRLIPGLTVPDNWINKVSALQVSLKNKHRRFIK